MIQRVLIANRGEIACRIIRTVQSMGLDAIAVYSEADAQALHVEMADDAVLIGPAIATESYLNIDNILQAATHIGADAMHPGYGFLAENSRFAEACESAGLVFIGPTPKAIALMGDKAEAKRVMIKAGVPCIPGYQECDQSDVALVAAADDVGYPVMIKAAAGGGGKGMRLVADRSEFSGALQLARSEAANAFGSSEVILEKAISRPRHVEIQVVADTHGNVIHLAERDCSVQRRHQKIVEEAPCPVLDTTLRQKMGQAAVDAARSIDYRGVGTVEFLLDQNGDFYFLEMNTRLQVEHPVTELITGLDLVDLQIRLAGGAPLTIAQSDVELTGHAMEVRLYAEDPAQDFQPSAGKIRTWKAPAGDGIRVDSGIEIGTEVSPFYDPMLAKIIAWGQTREIARHRLVKALDQTVLFGPNNNRHFLIEVLNNEQFVAGRATTALISEAPLWHSLNENRPPFHQVAVAAVLEYQRNREAAYASGIAVSAGLKNWSSSGQLATKMSYQCGDSHFHLMVSAGGDEAYHVSDGQAQCLITIERCDGSSARLCINGRKVDVAYAISDQGRVDLAMQASQWTFTNLAGAATRVADGTSDNRIIAPMHGLLQEVFVEPGDEVEVGSPLVVLEAMKMQHEITATISGVIKNVYCNAGDQIAADTLILEMERTK